MIERPSFWNGIRSSVKAMIPDFPFDTPIGMRNFNCDSKVLFLSRLVAFISDSMHAERDAHGCMHTRMTITPEAGQLKQRVGAINGTSMKTTREMRINPCIDL